jgi:hypothetical protein
MRAFSRFGTRPNRTAETRDTSGQLAASSQPPVYKQYTRTPEINFYPFPNTTQYTNNLPTGKKLQNSTLKGKFLHSSVVRLLHAYLSFQNTRYSETQHSYPLSRTLRCFNRPSKYDAPIQVLTHVTNSELKIHELIIFNLLRITTNYQPMTTY